MVGPCFGCEDGRAERGIAMLRDAVERNQLENVQRLYEASFPKSEKKPFAFMLQKQKEGVFDILAIEDEQGTFCGLAIMMLSGGRALLDYLAIEPDCQGSGIGSSALSELRERYGEERIVVEIESTAEENSVSGRTSGFAERLSISGTAWFPWIFLWSCSEWR